MARRREGLALCGVAVFLVLLLASATLDFHTGIHLELQLPAPASAERHLAAAHPEMPLHLEAAGGTVTPHCPACLRQLRTADRLATPLPACGWLAPRAAVYRHRCEAPAGAQRQPPISRGPPAA